MSERRSFLERARSEPLVWFAAIGALLFGLDRMRARGDEAHRIVIDDAFVEGLRTDAMRRTGHEPSHEETASLVDGWVREEALYREARELGLDVGDVIVRRRLVQKIELVLAAESAPDEPTEGELETYLAAHADRFAAPPRTSITLCFFARELHADAAGVATLGLTDDGRACDPHLSGDTFRERTDAQLTAIVGDAAVASMRDAALAAWVGPFETPRGFYLVRVDARTPGGPRALADVRDDVSAALLEERRDAAVHAREAEIAARYEVVRL